MKKIFTLCVVLCLSYLSMGATNPKHEFRATWLTTAWGNDWPKTKVTNATTRKQQQDSLIAIFDRLQAGNMNAVCFQVRGRSDAFYQSSYEPWAAELAGARGEDPGYDPLAFAIEEAHKRGLELHAWVNPFRVTSAGTLDANDLVKKNAGQWIIQYNNGSFTGEIIDPGYPEAREYVLNVLMEIISNYDIDGIVMDDYFYPYGGTTTEDAASKALHKPANVVDVNQDGKTDDDWRRSNVDVFLQELYDRIQAKKPWVRFGMGTFGIWTTQTKVAQAYGISLPSGISGLDDYDEQACNPVEWVKNGYVDYINPQLYWPTTSTRQNYNKLCQWWAKDVCEHFSNQLTNGKKVHFFSSQSISSNSAVSEIQAEIDANRSNLSSGYTGSVFFDTDAYLTMDKDLMTSRFATNALTPPMDWKSNTALAAPTNLTVSGSTLSWQHPTAERFTVYAYPKGTGVNTATSNPQYLQAVVYGKSFNTSSLGSLDDITIAVYTYDRYGVEHGVALYNADPNATDEPEPDPDPESSNAITWELNGGEVNIKTVEVPTNAELWEALKAYYQIFYSEYRADQPITAVSTFMTKACAIMTDAASEYKWLGDYIMSVAAEQGYTLTDDPTADGMEALWRWHVHSFLNCNQHTSWPHTADFSTAGQPSQWGTAYQIAHGAVLLPTYVTSAFTLPTPTHPSGHDFLGWYDNAEFTGSPLTTIPAGWTGTLYAKWNIIDPTWQILYTSTDSNIVTPNRTDVFGANIISNTYKNGIGTITFDGPVTSIGYEAFLSCSSLTSITIPNSVTSIGDWAFYECSYLESITIPNSVKNIGVGAFSVWNLTTIVVEAGNTYYDSRSNCDAIIETATNTLIAGCQNTIIPNNVTSIGNYAFFSSSLTSITIPISVTSIGEGAFRYCSRLTSITIPNSVIRIGNDAFLYCSRLTSITIPNSVKSIGDYAFENCSSLATIRLEATTPPALGEDAFNSTPLCYIACGTLAAYQASDWAQYVSEFVEEDCPKITYELNGGVTNDYGWTTKGAIALDLQADYNAAYETSKAWAKAENGYIYYKIGTDWVREDLIPEGTDCTVTGFIQNVTYNTADNLKNLINDNEKYAWLKDVIIANRTAAGLDANLSENIYRKELSAFFLCSPAASSWPASSSYEAAGKYESFKTIWLHGFANPTNPTIDFVLNAPYREGYTFAGWYTNADFSGEKVTTINAETTGTLYAKWIDDTWVIKYTSTDGNIVTPNATDVFGANIVSNTYENGVGTITFDGPVTSIGVMAFDDCDALTSITIPNSVTSIGNSAFYNCSSLTSITIPNSVTSIGFYAFTDCTSLTSVTLGSGVTSIGNQAFDSCTSLTSITIPNSVTSIGPYAFRYCSSLTSITIPESVTSIGSQAFSGCTSLTSMVVEPGNTIYDSRENCNAIIKKATNTLIAGCQKTVIPNSVMSIGKQAFYECTSLTSITIPNSVTSIGEDAFDNCTSLASVTLGSGVTSIGDRAFRGCTSLTSITIPNSVTSIGEDAFMDCTSLISITIPNSVTSIGDWTFLYCTSLTSITIPESVTSIGVKAFGYCSSLTSVTLGSGVTSIGEDAFQRCTSLTSITIPNSVTSIEDYAFGDCFSLTSITCEATTPPTLGSDVFPSELTTAYIPCGTKEAYEASAWASQVSEFVEEGCVPIQMCGDNLYWEYADGLLTITGTGDMYDYAADTDVPWYDVRGNIKTVSLPDAMTKIGQNAFYKCTAMTSINMPTSLTAIGEKAFAQDTKLACEIILPASMTTIASRAFFNCQAVTAFHIEATTPPTIPNDAFERTTAPIHVPCGYGHVYGKHTRWGMLNLEMCELLQDNVYYYPIDGHTARAVTYHSNPTDTLVIPSAVVIDGMPRTVTEVADFAFTDCDDLPAIYFSEGLEYIGERAFVRCYGLQGTIVLPATLETIGERAFSYCDHVTKYILQAMTPPALANNVFTGSNSNALFYISCEAMDDYKVATNWSKLKSRFVDACLNIYHYNTALGANGVHTTEDTLVAGIYYRRLFTPNVWETLYLPFDVDRVTVLEDGIEYDLEAWSIFSGGHYFLATPYGIENKEVVFGFTTELKPDTPYIIQFKDEYYRDKMITFYGSQSWNHLSTSFEALTSSFDMQMAGNTTLQDQILEEPVYMLRGTSNFILQNTTTTLHPFECYVMPYATPSGTPARMNVRFRGDVPTAVESVKGNESHLTYTVDGYTLTVYPQGQAFSIYSLNGALIYSCEAGKEAVDCELNSGCYLLHAGTEAHKIML